MHDPIFPHRVQASRRSPRVAYTIVEVIMAVAVFSLVFTTSITTLQSGFNAIDTARATTLAAQIAQSTMENIRLRPWLTDPARPTVLGISALPVLPASLPIDIQALYGSSLPPSKQFACTLTTAPVTDAAGVAMADMRQLTVTVTWIGLDNRSHTLSSMLYYARNGLYDFFYTVH